MMPEYGKKIGRARGLRFRGAAPLWFKVDSHLDIPTGHAVKTGGEAGKFPVNVVLFIKYIVHIHQEFDIFQE